MPNEIKICQSCKTSFEIFPEDVLFYQKMKVPEPTWCPECRAKRRLVWRGERALYRKKSDATGKEIFSMFHPSMPYKIYEYEYWHSDAWDPMQHGREIDWSRPFLAQLRELELAVPKAARSIQNLEASDYSNNASNLKNCYLVFTSSNSENSLYCTGLIKSRDSVDCSYVFENELCYGCVMCDRCFGCKRSVDCTECSEVIFSKNLLNCSHCFGCVNLRNKQHCIFNQQYSKAEYEKKMQEFALGSYRNVERLRQESEKFWLQYPVRFMHGAKSEEMSGDYIFNSSDVKHCYSVFGGEHCRYSHIILSPGKDCYDYSIWGLGAELVYETAQCGLGIARMIGCFGCFPNCTDLEYAMHCHSSSLLFGCVGLRNKKYCILNKQYSPEEYEALTAKLRTHMREMPYVDALGRTYQYGDYLPIEFAPYGYNESIPAELFPLSKSEALAQGFRWQEFESRTYKITMPAAAIPDDISAVPETVVKEVVGCAHSGTCEHNCTTAFQILPQELEFYKKHNIPLPRLCHNCRHSERIRWRNPARFATRRCECAGETSAHGTYKNTVSHVHGASPCQNEFQTAYPSDRPEIVYCDACYKAEVF